MASTETRRIQFDFIARDRGVGRQMRETGEQAEEMNEGLEQGSGKMGKLSGAAAKLGPVLMALGTAAAVVGPMVAKGLDAQAATAKFRAQLGLTAKESKRIGGVAGKLYAQAYGENMDEVRAAITQVIRNMDGMREASSADLKETTARAMTLAEVMDEDVGRVTAAVSQIMRTGLAKDSREAFDIMARGAQLGANKAEDLADTFEEYSVQFQSMGLTGAQAMGLMVQGLKAGGRNADLVADSIKEFAIEAVKGGEGVRKGLTALGFNADTMIKKFSAGGPRAAQGFDQMMDKLRGVENETKRNQIAADLFGTKSEDMARALVALDPSKATAALGKFAGATDRAGDAMHNTAKAKLTSFKRTVEVAVINVAGRAVGAVGRLYGQFKQGFQLKDASKAKGDLQALGVIARRVADWFKERVLPNLREFAKWVAEKVAPVVRKFHKEVLGELVKQLRKIGDTLKDNSVEFNGIGRVVKRVAEFFMKHAAPAVEFLSKTYLKVFGFAVRAAIKVLAWLWRQAEDTWRIFVRGRATLQDWSKSARSAFRGMRDVAVSVLTRVTRVFLSFVTTLVKGAAKAFGWVPGLGGKLKRAAREVEDFKDRTNKAIGRITKSRNVDIKVRAGGSWKSPGGRPWGPGTDTYATGGQVLGTVPGATRAYDSQPALLRVDEHVWTPEEVDAAGGHSAVYRLRAMAKRGLLKGYAAGGAVTRGMGLSVSVPSSKKMNGIFDRIGDGMWSMVKKIAAMLAKMGGANGVVRAARAMLGLPYSWGGGGRGGPSYGIGRGAGTYGFDCSGLTEYAWWKGARVGIGGVTYSQHPASRPIAGPRPGALGFNASLGHVVLASDKPGYVIEAPYTGAHVREVRKSMPDWRWPKGARFATGGRVERLGQAMTRLGGTAATQLAKLTGIAGDPGKRRAVGGPVLAGEPYLVGERGPEVMVPGVSGSIAPAGATVITIQRLELKFADDRNMYKKGLEFAEGLREVRRRGGRIPTNGRND